MGDAFAEAGDDGLGGLERPGHPAAEVGEVFAGEVEGTVSLVEDRVILGPVFLGPLGPAAEVVGDVLPGHGERVLIRSAGESRPTSAASSAKW